MLITTAKLILRVIAFIAIVILILPFIVVDAAETIIEWTGINEWFKKV